MELELEQSLLSLRKIMSDSIIDNEINTFVPFSLSCFCACSSYLVFMKYKDKYNLKFAGNYEHCFIIKDEDTVIDLTATQFNRYYNYSELETNFRIYDNENYLQSRENIWIEEFSSNNEIEIKDFLKGWEDQNPYQLLETEDWFKSLAEIIRIH